MIHFETSFPVRYYEADPMGIVHHSNYLRYFECARDEMIASWGYGIEACGKEGLTFPVAAADLRFKHSLLVGDTAVVSAEIREIPMAKLVVHQRVCNQNGDVCAEGVVTLGFLVNGRISRCPEKLMSLIEKEFNK